MKHRLALLVALGAALTPGIAAASDDDSKADPSNAGTNAPPREFAPMTKSERFTNYLTHLADPGSVLQAAASAGIKQASNSPKEWGGGAETYGDRVGSALAQHMIQRTLMYGSSWALHEDNRYSVSGQTGFSAAPSTRFEARCWRGTMTTDSPSRSRASAAPPARHSFRASGSREA